MRTFSPLLRRGFSLMELMIVITIIGIMARIAIPYYGEYVAKGRRSEAQSTILQLASWLERYYSENNCYAALVSSACPTAGAAKPTLPSTLLSTPNGCSGTSCYYTLDVGYTVNGVTSGQNYFITATRTGTMASDKCGDFTYDQAQRKSSANGTAAASTCWGQ